MAGVFTPAMFGLRNRLVRISLVLLALLPATVLRAEHDGDMRYWQSLAFNFHDGPNWRIKATAQTRLFDDANFLGAYLVFPTVEYKIHENVDLGATYLYEAIRGEAAADYTMLNIYWLHATTHFKLTDKLNFSMRNVLGYRDYEAGQKEDYWINRNKFALSYQLEDMGRLVAVGVSTELFYHLDEGYLFENRAVPLSLTFKLTDQAKLTLYGMVQSKNYVAGDGWEHAYIFGQTLSYKF